MRFRPCIDLHDGVVKQIVGATLTDAAPDVPETNFTAEKPAAWFAECYRKDGLTGGHVIQLGPGNREAARAALAAWPGGLQIGGGVTAENAVEWLDAGASHVIVTSYVFYNGAIDMDRLTRLVTRVGTDRLVLDLSCRRRGNAYYVVTDWWQCFTDAILTPALLDQLAGYCDEFLVHAVDVEGTCSGIEIPVVELLGGWEGGPVTYAGGIRSWADIQTIGDLGKGHVDFTVGSALDIFGGTWLRYDDIVASYGPSP
ncbi:MAG: phosphoribosylformimino-5-aminoimidazole carboxamide ribotide isomerase [Deltaproteobacteria bacterium]|nr:MAG: phosphoribosylformimino-5-aminoimidazole carboxamide ribotide isomerase [Deltaproteobacteria bacterium]